MSAEEWAEAIRTARKQYVFNVPGDEEVKWREQVAYVAGAMFVLGKAGLVDYAEICNESVSRCSDL